MKKNKYTKGFTLVELIVTMSIIGVLVLLAAPRFMGNTQEARRARHLQTVNELERAAERFYSDEGDWPRLSDEPYTPEEVKEFADKVMDNTGVEADLSLNENYYEIDYDALNDYVRIPEEDKDYYVFANPVGEFYYLEGLKDKPERHIYDVIDKEPEGGSGEKEEVQLGRIVDTATYGDGDIEFKGLNAAAFDGNTGTGYNFSGTQNVTWIGDLTDREIEIAYRNTGSWSHQNTTIYFADASGQKVPAVNSNNENIVTEYSGTTDRTRRVVVPDEANRIVIIGSNNRIMNIATVAVSSDRPTSASISSTSTPSSVTLNWEGVNRAIIRKDGRYLTQVNNGTSYTHRPLYADREHTYEVILMDSSGNGQRHTYTARTTKDVVAFRGLTAAAFDGNTSTGYNFSGTQNVTWIGDLTDREIEIAYRNTGSWSHQNTTIYFADASGQKVPAVNSNNENIVTEYSGTTDRTRRVVVPDEANRIVIIGSNNRIMNIATVAVSSDRPTSASISSTSTPSSVTLNWEGVNRAIIRKDGRYLTQVNNGTSYTHRPLYADREHTYEVILMDSSGNGQRHTYKALTTKDVVAFRGLTAAAFDGNTNTGYNFSGTQNVTWIGDLTDREIEIAYRNTGSWTHQHTTIYFADASGQKVPAVNSNNEDIVTEYSATTDSTRRVVVPDEADRIVITGSNNRIMNIGVIK